MKPLRAVPQGEEEWLELAVVLAALATIPLPVALRRYWDAREAAAREQMGREVGQCMDEKDWIFCAWFRERSDFSSSHSGQGWLCRRKHPDDPDPP